MLLFSGDIIIKEGTIGTKMYFIQEGVVDIVMANGEVSILIIIKGKKSRNVFYVGGNIVIGWIVLWRDLPADQCKACSKRPSRDILQFIFPQC